MLDRVLGRNRPGEESLLPTRRRRRRRRKRALCPKVSCNFNLGLLAYLNSCAVSWFIIISMVALIFDRVGVADCDEFAFYTSTLSFMVGLNVARISEWLKTDPAQN